MPDAQRAIERTLRIGTRGSKLARWQTDHVRSLLLQAHPSLHIEVEVMVTQGDRVLDKPLPEIGGKGLFTAELEGALHDGRIDLAIHSLKDLPTEHPRGLTIGAVPEREDPRDVLVSRGRHTLRTLPHGASVGTSSLRRAAQLRRVRPDLQMIDIRGNIDTRVRKALDPSGGYDAVVLAAAGLCRLGMSEVISEFLSFDDMLPSPGQAALAVQCRDEPQTLNLLAPLTHAPTAACVAAERAFLAGLGGGCAVPVAALATINGGIIRLAGRVSDVASGEHVDVALERALTTSTPEAIGVELAAIALARGARSLLEQRA